MGGGFVLNTLKACIDKVEIVCKYRAFCAVLFLNGRALSCKREEVGALETGQGACGWSWRASFLEEKSGWVGSAVSIKSIAGGENDGC